MRQWTLLALFISMMLIQFPLQIPTTQASTTIELTPTVDFYVSYSLDYPATGISPTIYEGSPIYMGGYLNLQSDYGTAYIGFAEYDISNIPDDADVIDARFRYTGYHIQGTVSMIAQGMDPNQPQYRVSTWTSTSEIWFFLDDKSWYHEFQAPWPPYPFPQSGTHEVVLGGGAESNIEQMLSHNWFALSFRPLDIFGAASYGSSIRSSSVSGPPTLIITYTMPIQYTLTVDSEYGATTGSGLYNAGATATFSVIPDPLNHGNGTQRDCIGYSGDASGSTSSGSIQMTSDKTITFNWQKQYQLTVSSNTGGSTDPSGSSWRNINVYISVSATADTGYEFGSWSDGGLQIHDVYMNAPKSITATFFPKFYSITIDSSPRGSSFVKVDGTPVTTPFPLNWEYGSSYTLTATDYETGNTRYAFSSWSDGGLRSHTYTVTGSETITANFDIEYKLILSSTDGTPSGAGWKSSGSTASFSVNSPITSGNARATCIGYSGSATGDGSSGTIYMNEPKTIIFNWAYEYYLTLNSTITATLTGEGWYDEDATATPSVTTPSGWFFQYWYQDNDVGGIHDTNPFTTIVMDAPHILTAKFTQGSEITIGSKYHTVIVDGNTYPPSQLPKEFNWEPNSDHTLRIKDLSVTIGDDIYTFTQWSDGNTNRQRTIKVVGSDTYNVNYDSTSIQYDLVLSASPSVTTLIGAGTYDVDTDVQISVIIPSGYAFLSWKEGSTIIATTINTSITMDEGHSIIAYLEELDYYIVTITVEGFPSSESTRVYLDGQLQDSIDGGETSSINVSKGVSYIISVDVAVDVTSGRYFCSAPDTTVSESKVSHTFNYILQYNLRLLSEPVGIGVRGGGWYEAGTNVQIEAPNKFYTEEDEWTFKSWSGSGNIASKISSITEVKVSSDTTVVAKYTSQPKTEETLTIQLLIKDDTQEPPYVEGAEVTIVDVDDVLIHHDITDVNGLTDFFEIIGGEPYSIVVRVGNEARNFDLAPEYEGTYTFVIKHGITYDTFWMYLAMMVLIGGTIVGLAVLRSRGKKNSWDMRVK